MANRTSIQKLDYQELLQLGIEHLLNRMKGNATQEVKDKIALTLIGKAIPQTMALNPSGDWLTILNTYYDKRTETSRDGGKVPD